MKHKLTTKLPAILIALVMILSMVPMGVLAAESIPESSVTLTFSDSGVTASGSGSGYEIDGAALKITESGVYTVTGESAEGSITVKKGTTGVTLILQDLTLSCSTTAPLACNKGTETTLYIVGTVTLNDNESLDNEESDDFEGAAIKVKSESSRLTIRGAGTLNVNGNCKNGIKGGATADIIIESGTINVTAANTGIASDNSLTINGGTITVTAGNEGIKSAPDDDDTESLGNLTISGGTINVTAEDDAIHADGDLTIKGGVITASAGDDGIHADGVLTIDDGDITVTKSYEGLEGASIYLNGGSGSITASDDGVNAADDANGTVTIEINGGTWYVNAGGDGLDAGGENNRGNGTIVFNGGVIEVYGASNSGNAALDSESGITHNGGTVLAVGMSGMIDLPASGVYVTFGSTTGMMGGGFGGGGRQNGGQWGQMPEGQTGEMPEGQQGGFNPGQMGEMPEGQQGGFGGGRQNGGQWGQMPGGQTGEMPEGQQGGFDPSQMGQMPGDMTQTGDGSGFTITAGTEIVIKDSNGATLYSATGVKNANNVIFIADSLTEGATYTLYLDGAEAATATATAGTGFTGGFGGGGMRGQEGAQQGQTPTQQGGQTPGQQSQTPAGNQNGKPQVVLSPQTFTVNGEEATSEIYNIDGNNYFKLRDLAALLSGTGSQFNVDYDAARNVIVIITLVPYTTAAGDELQTGTDNSASAVVSPQSIEINGAAVELTAYNIGGSNFFKLRDLGAALGFDVGYDEATNTASITSR